MASAVDLSVAHALALVRDARDLVARGAHFLTAPPFGPLNPLHEHIIAHAVGFTPARVARYLAPLVVLYAQSYLLLAPGTRYSRAALGAAALGGMWSAWTGIRFTNPWHNCLNHVITMPYIVFMVKALEFSLLKGPIRDPYMPQRSRAVAAWDLMINNRLLGLGNVGVDNAPGIPNAKAQRGQVERHLRLCTGRRPQGRAASIARHLAYAAVCYVSIDTYFQLLPHLDPVFRVPCAGPNTLSEFANRGTLRLLPGTLDYVMPPMAIVIAVELFIGLHIWMWFEGLYQLFAVVHLLVGWPVESWDPNMFGSMWRADSLIDLWGTRWHQTFRHLFIVCSYTLLRALNLPMNGPVIFLATFFFSGLLHVLCEVPMDPVGSPRGLLVFFLLAGLGCALEVTFKHATGHKVRGRWGQLWTWGYMAVTGMVCAPAWLASGYGSTHVTPPGGPGEYAARLIATYLLAGDAA